MARLREIRNTDPMRFMVAAAVNDHTYVKPITNSLQNNFYNFFLLLKGGSEMQRKAISQHSKCSEILRECTTKISKNLCIVGKISLFNHENSF